MGVGTYAKFLYDLRKNAYCTYDEWKINGMNIVLEPMFPEGVIKVD